jgi:sugar phosphate isomerase/epimerase
MYLMKNFNRFFFILISITTISIASQAQEIGLELYSLRAQFAKDVVGTLDKIKQMGFKEIEMGGSYGYPAKTFKSMLDERGLKVVAYGADFNQLSMPDSIIYYAKLYGAKYVVCFWIPHKESFTEADAKNAIAVFNSAGKVLKENGLQLCYHPHGYEFASYQNGTLFDYMVQQTNPQYANFEMDVFWVKHPGQDPVALLKKYPNRFPLMHLKDRKPGTPGNQLGQADEESNVILGAGDVGIAEIMQVSPKVGVKHYFIEDESSISEQQMPESIKYIKSLKK